MDREDRLRAMYSAFNAREIDTVLAALTEDVDWPNAWEGGRVHGRGGVRDYWTRQWAQIDSKVEPLGFTTRGDDIVAVDVKQWAHSLDGEPLGEARVVHVYEFDGDLVARMDVEEAAEG